MCYRSIKRNKRLWIVHDTETNVDGLSQTTTENIYTPPDFVVVPSRKEFEILADKFNSGGYDINVIAEFESKFSKRKIRK